MAWSAVWDKIDILILWGFVAIAVMTTVLSGSQWLGLSRMSLPFLAGSLFTGNRRYALGLGAVLYLLGGWAFAVFYALVFEGLQQSGALVGLGVGVVHGLFLLLVALPAAPAIHPRIATEYDGPTASRRIEPPGFMGLNYGRQTPVVTLIGQALYGAILGATYPV